MKDTMDDHELLEAYAKRREEAAFRELVARHIDMVYATARRITGDGDRARDVAQAVFMDLARKPQRVREPRALGGWLYLAARYAASQAARGEQRRQRWEREAMKQGTGEDGSGQAWAAAGPVLDEALGTLKPAEAGVIVRRFFEGKSLRETGAALQISEDAAQKRVTRALEKLRRHFHRRGAVTTAAVLAEALEAHAAQAAPAGLAESVASGALAAGAGGAGLGMILAMSTKSKILIAVAALAAASLLTVVYQQRELTALRAQLAAAQGGAKNAGPKGKNAADATTAPSQSEGDLLARVRQILAMKPPSARDGPWSDFVDRLNPADFEKAAKILLAQPLTRVQSNMADRLLEAWGKVAPAQALAFAESSPAFTQLDRFVFEGWIETDPAAAIAWWQQQPGGVDHDYEGDYVVNQLTRSDPEAALQVLLGMKVEAMDSGGFMSLFMKWGENDPAGAVAALAELPAGPLRNNATWELAAGWAAEDPQAEIAWAQTLPQGDEREKNVGRGIEELSHSNLAEAIADINSLPSEERTVAIENVMQSDANAGPEAMWAVAQQVTDASNRDSAIDVMLSSEAQSNPQETLKWLESVPPEAGNTTQWMQSFAGDWARYDPAKAMAGAANVPEGPQRDAYVAGLLNGVTHSVPVQAEGLVASLPADQQAEAANKVAAAVAAQNPAAAAQWMATLPDGTVTAETVNTLMDQWADNDPAAAGQWIANLPTGTMQDGAAAKYVNDAANDYPAAAAQVAADIGDAEKRAAAETTTAAAWLKKDPAAAEAWLAKTDLPDSTKQELLAKAGGK
jgi:RNA polymerase sigma factor (sigma-70 family)